MALIRRLRRITRGRIEAFLASLERPEEVLPVLVKELGDAVTQAARAEAKALAAVRGAQRNVDEASGRAARMRRGAQLAVDAGDTDLARRALAAEIDAEKDLTSHQQDLQRTQEAYEDARAAREQLQTQHAWLRDRAKSLAARASVDRQTLEALQERLAATGKGQSVLDVVARMEAAVDQQQDEAQALTDVARQIGPDLAARDVEELADQAEVERRLDALRRRKG